MVIFEGTSHGGSVSASQSTEFSEIPVHKLRRLCTARWSNESNAHCLNSKISVGEDPPSGSADPPVDWRLLALTPTVLAPVVFGSGRFEELAWESSISMSIASFTLIRC